jgi:co-chaperonin GroES (HSP10)
LKKDDVIYYDKHAGHKIEIKDKSYHVIKTQDVVVVL